MNITVSALQQVDWRSVEEAARGWKLLSDQATYARDDLTQRGANNLQENWTDPLGQRAGDYLRALVAKYDCANLLLNSVGMVVNGLANSLEIAQRQLITAEEYAARYRFRIDDDGSVRYTGSALPEARQEAMQHHDEISRMVVDALEAANQADGLARDRLLALAEATSITDPGQALGMNNQDSQAQIQLITYAIPHGQPPEVVAAWWTGLSNDQRREMVLAAPLDLYDLPGIPDQVKQDLAGPPPFNRMEMIRYAAHNWNQPTPHVYDNNCTNFVSYALLHGGANEFTYPFGDNHTDWYQPGRGILQTDSMAWSNAQANHDFLVGQGSQQLTSNDAQPGDVVYWRNPDGRIHHAAIITSVSPDGDIHYTQHTDSMRNSSLDGRLPQTEQWNGDQEVEIVRPNGNW